MEANIRLYWYLPQTSQGSLKHFSELKRYAEESLLETELQFCTDLETILESASRNRNWSFPFSEYKLISLGFRYLASIDSSLKLSCKGIPH